MSYFVEFQVSAGAGISRVNRVRLTGEDRGLACALNFIESRGYEIGPVILLTPDTDNPVVGTVKDYLVMAKRVRRPLTDEERADNANLVQLYVNTLAHEGVSVQSDALALLYEILKVRFEGVAVDA